MAKFSIVRFLAKVDHGNHRSNNRGNHCSNHSGYGGSEVTETADYAVSVDSAVPG